jgi:hypothetical protein
MQARGFMTYRMFKRACATIATACLMGCAFVPTATKGGPATAPAVHTQGGSFVDKNSGIQISWPDGWKQEQSKDYNVLLDPDGAPPAAEEWVSVDIPDLPMHIPNMIPIGRVESGYLDDLRKNHGHIDVQELTPPSISNAKLRLVRAAWSKDGQSTQQTALLIVHGDHVYIIRLRSDVKEEADLRKGFDSVCGSIHWVK